MPGSTPARCCWPKRLAIGADETARRAARLRWRRSARAADASPRWTRQLSRSGRSPSEGVTYAAKIDKAESAARLGPAGAAMLAAGGRAPLSRCPAPGSNCRTASALKVLRGGRSLRAGAPGTLLGRPSDHRLRRGRGAPLVVQRAGQGRHGWPPSSCAASALAQRARCVTPLQAHPRI